MKHGSGDRFGEVLDRPQGTPLSIALHRLMLRPEFSPIAHEGELPIFPVHSSPLYSPLVSLGFLES